MDTTDVRALGMLSAEPKSLKGIGFLTQGRKHSFLHPTEFPIGQKESQNYMAALHSFNYLR